MPEGETMPKKTDPSSVWEKKTKSKEDQYRSESKSNSKQWTGVGWKGNQADYMRALEGNLQQLRSGTMAKKRQELAATPRSFKKGGKVRKTGLALVHRGEVVIPAGKRTSTRKTGRR